MNKLAKSLSYAVIAQIISLLVSVFISFFVSKFMPIVDFGYYQLFLFYSTYVGLFQFGISEGVYLENGGNRYEHLKKEDLKQMFINTLLVEVTMVTAIYCFVTVVARDANKKIVMLFIAFYALTHLFVMFFGMLLQAVNFTEKYSSAIIAGKLFTLILFFSFVIVKNYNYIWYCLAFLMGYMVSGLIVSKDCIEIIRTRIKPEFVLFKRYKTIIAGASLLLSGLISSFIIGINRIYIEQILGIEVFAKVSMALSLCNFVILFAIQIGMVMFPNVVLLGDDRKTQLYTKLNGYTSILAPMVFVGYVPLKVMLSIWIPQYNESIRWMLLFVPYMIYEIKTQIMYNTYLKAQRKEKILLIINLAALLVCAAVNYYVIVQYQSVVLMFWVIDIVMIIKSFMLSRTIENSCGLNLSWEMTAEAICLCISTYLAYTYYKFTAFFAVIIIYSLFIMLFERNVFKR